MFRKIKYYIRNRWHRKTHVLPTGFKPGEYHDLRERLLYGCMEALVDFVEVEKAWMAFIGDDDNKIKLDLHGRNTEAGLGYLDWEMALTDSPNQAAAAKEVAELYHWWKVDRPARPDPFDPNNYGSWILIEDAQDEEDNAMLIRLMTIRLSLWT